MAKRSINESLDPPSSKKAKTFHTEPASDIDYRYPFSYADDNDTDPNTLDLGNTKTDRTRWRMLDERGRQRWRYLRSEKEANAWPMNTYEKYNLGLDTKSPSLPPARTPSQSVNNGLSFFAALQQGAGNWACEYGGPMFLLPGLIITWHVTSTSIPPEYRIEIANYLFARQHPEDGGWGLHIEGITSVFGTAMNYTALRLVGVDAEDERMIKARSVLHKMGGPTEGPLWAKFWLCTLGVFEWEGVNPVPPELWLLPDWTPISPWRWWIHQRQVFLPMSYIWSKRFAHPLDDVTRSLRKELFVQPYDSIDWPSVRNNISPYDNYHPKSMFLNTVNWLIVNVHVPFTRTNALKSRAEDWSYKLIEMEDENTIFANLGPVNAPMNTLARFIKECSSDPLQIQTSTGINVRHHLDRLHDFLWMKHEGLLMNGTNGVQVWDTAFAIQAVVSAGLGTSPAWKPMLMRALEFLDDQQVKDEIPDLGACYRYPHKGAWMFSNKDQGYTVSDCVAEALKSVLLLQDLKNLDGTPHYPQLVSLERVRWAIDILLGMQNASGGFASYEERRGNPWLLEQLNAAEVFGGIMVEYDYPECTTAVLLALGQFIKSFPDDEYRRQEIKTCQARAVQYVRDAQRVDGSWYGSWGICFTYASMFALASLATVGESCANSERVRTACAFLVEKQDDDGGWGESYKACETEMWVPHPTGSQVVQTAMAALALMEAGYEDAEPLKRAMRLLMRRQLASGEWPQEGIEGVFNKSCEYCTNTAEFSLIELSANCDQA